MAIPDQDVIDLNLGWLVTARDLSRNDPQKAAIVLGIDEARMALLSHLTLQELRAIARSGILLLRPR
ncbi:MAG: flagellar transcriptional regulator FlhD, partial [Gammaproteobacteria bacterium]|nr:flagellar transcriptional regulator FlhD [Gammaproteobacteria bacterium]